MTAILVCLGLLALAPAAQGLELGPPLPVVPPAISGGTGAGQTVTCSPGTWTNTYVDTTYTYAWQRSGSAISGQTSSSYTLASSDVSQPITCTVTATNPGAAAPNSATSVPSIPLIPVTLPLPTPPVPVAPPSITPAIADPGQALICNSGTWTGATSFVYTWQSNGTEIPGAVGQTYTVASADVGSAITCTVNATGAGGSTSATSLPVVPAPATPPAGPGGTGGGSSGGTGGSSSGGTGGSSGGGTGSSGGGTGTSSSGGGAGSSSGGGTGGSSGSRPSGSSGAPYPAGAPKGPAPVLRMLTTSPRKVLVTVRGTRQSTNGVVIKYSLNRRAVVLLYVVRLLSHHKSQIAAILSRKAAAGMTRMTYGLRSGGRVLGAGEYEVVALAVSNGAWSAAQVSSFDVALKRVKTHRPAHRGAQRRPKSQR